MKRHASGTPGMANAARIAIGMLTALVSISEARAEASIDSSRRNAIVRAIEMAAPAVVTINVVEIRHERVPDPFIDDFWGMFGGPLGRPRIRGRAVESLGTGFIFDAQGHIVTNYHVLQDASAISSIALPDGRNVEAELVGADPRTDIAVLRAKDIAVAPARFGNSDDLLVGEWVIAIGNPFGNMMRDPQPSVSVGVISAKHRRVSRDVAESERLYQDLIQTDAAINPGNSGGPLVNAAGEVIGVNTMIFSNSGGSQGLGFAIPVNRVKRVTAELIQFGHRRDPWIGIHGQAVGELDPRARLQYGINAESGVFVTEMMRVSPAAEAGLQLGDVIVEFNGQPVAHPAEVDFVNWDLFVGDQATLTVDRQGKKIRLTFPIQELRK